MSTILPFLQIGLQILFVLLLSIGGTFLLSDLFNIPTLKVSQTVKHFTKRQPRKGSSFLDSSLGDLSRAIAKKIKLNEYKREALQHDLKAGGYEESPEEYIAFAGVKAGFISLIVGLIAVLFCLVIQQAQFALIAGLGCTAIFFAVFFRNYKKTITRKLADKKSAIENELPRFIAIIAQQIQHDKDIIKILDKFKETACPEFREELSITVADMRSGNYEEALTRMEERINSSLMSDVSRGLISVVRGDEVDVFWENMSVKCSALQKQKLMKQAAKAPPKINKLAMLMLFAFIGIFFYVIIAQAASNLDVLFT